MKANLIKWLGVATLFCAGMIFISCGDKKTAQCSKEKPCEYKFSHVVSENTPKGKAANYFAKLVKERSNGRLVIHVFPSAQLIDDDKIFQELKRNNVQFGAPSFSKFTPLAKEFNLWDVPFIFRDTDHLHAVMDGEVGEILKNAIATKGFIALSYWDAGFKQFSTNKKPILNPSDVQGQKVRIMSSKVLEEQIKAVNGNPQVLPFGEVYSALQTGVVDAAENPLSNLYNSKFYEVQKSITLSNHGYLGYLVVASEKFWASLSESDKALIESAMKEATEYERIESAKEEALLLKRLQTNDKTGTKIYELSPAQKAEWESVMRAIYPKFYDLIGEDLIKKTLETQAQ